MPIVTPCMGVWIETSGCIGYEGAEVSHPVWVCGLKPMPMHLVILILSHTLYGCVDWNKVGADTEPPLVGHTLYGCVDWNIEDCLTLEMETSHTLYGCVDWNNTWVLKYFQSWGHTLYGCVDWNIWIWWSWYHCRSHPVWVCGLKLIPRIVLLRLI